MKSKAKEESLQTARGYQAQELDAQFLLPCLR